MVDFFLEATKKALREVEAFIFNEDFACNAGPLVSPKIYREFFLPRHETIIRHLRRFGMKVIELDSDGNTEALIPFLIEAGIDCHWPLEAAADMAPLKIRKEYGEDLALCGGIDKRELAKDRKAIEREVSGKILPMMDLGGGYVRTVDHTVPPDVPLKNFVRYLQLKAKIAENSD